MRLGGTPCKRSLRRSGMQQERHSRVVNAGDLCCGPSGPPAKVFVVLKSMIIRTVVCCTRYAWVTAVLAAILIVVSGIDVARHFAINTDITDLISRDLPWRQRELAYQEAFPQSTQSILAVIHAPTPELSAAAGRALVQNLSKRPELFRSIGSPGTGSFFERNGLLFLPTKQLQQKLSGLSQAAPFIRVLAADPSLRGAVQVLNIGLQGLRAERYSLDDMAPSLNMAANTIEDVLAGRAAAFSWKELLSGKSARPEDLRHLFNLWTNLDYSELQPGHKATEAVRQAAAKARIAAKYQADMRLTGAVPIADQEFGTLREGAATNGIVTAAIIVTILWLALRSLRTVLAVVMTLGGGLAVTAALGLLLVGELNPISIAFAVLFVGLGADFAIQYSVRYRAERHASGDLQRALVGAAERVGVPLTLAAAAAAAGFLSFMPTSYRGIAELGLIAGCGMAVAYVLSLTLLPALIRLVRAPPEPEPLSYAALAPADRFLQKHRVAVVAVTMLIAVAGLPALGYLKFDFNPLHLRNPQEEAIATYRELSRDPRIGMDSAQILLSSTAQAQATAKTLSKVPEVAQTRTIWNFVPDDQEQKLSIIASAAKGLEQALNPSAKPPPPSDADNIAALKTAAQSLQQIAGNSEGAGAQSAQRLAKAMNSLAEAAASDRAAVAAAMIEPLKWDLNELREALHPQRVTLETVPNDLKRDWITPTGITRIEVMPKGDPDDNETLHRFARAVLAAEPTATGQAITTFNWADTIVHAFAEAGIWAFCSIALLLWIVLRRIWDVALTLIPLLVAAAVTLEICALSNFELNYANIIALPVLLGVGVAFKIYYVMAWRQGQSSFLQSTLTRAVFFSALMTATAFGSLWFSSHPGTSSMGKLLALSLACTLASAALFQPALMGLTRTPADSGPD